MEASKRDGRNGGTRDGQHVALVHDRLRDLILRGELPAGQTTSQVTLARDLDVGRTPLREALRMLQREGLVVSEPNRRVRIAALSSTDAEELYVMRIALEAVAVRITVPTLASTDFAELEGLMAQMDHYMRSEDRQGMRVPHRAFHDRLVRGAGERVTLTIGQLFDHGERYRLAYGATTPERWDQRRAEHRAIFEAAAAGDADLTARRLVEHYAQTARFIFAAIDPGHDLIRLRTTMATVAPGSEAALERSDRR
jgi:DNA-binding GntR family transcriptional regulator